MALWAHFSCPSGCDMSVDLFLRDNGENEDRISFLESKFGTCKLRYVSCSFANEFCEVFEPYGNHDTELCILYTFVEKLDISKIWDMTSTRKFWDTLLRQSIQSTQ